jgi:hypothetical protein
MGRTICCLPQQFPKKNDVPSAKPKIRPLGWSEKQDSLFFFIQKLIFYLKHLGNIIGTLLNQFMVSKNTQKQNSPKPKNLSKSRFAF